MKDLTKTDKSLNPDDIKKAENLAKQLNISDDTALMNFGIDTQKKLGDASTKILNGIKTKDADEAGDALASLVMQIKGCDIEPNWFEKNISKVPIIGKVFDYSRKIVVKYSNVESNLDEIVHTLDKSRLSLLKDNVSLKNLYEDTIKFINDNKVNIEALNIHIKDLDENIIPEKERELQNDPSNELLIQELTVLKNKKSRVEKKIYNFKLFEVSSIQSLPRLLLIQDGNKQLCETIQTSVLNTIPLWRNQVAEAITLNKQHKVAKLSESVYDMTNELIRSNSLRTKENTLLIAKQMERGIIDVETLDKANKDFIETLDEVIKIKEEGRKARIEAEKKLESIKDELSDKIKSIHLIDKNETFDTTYEDVSESDDILSLK